MITLDIVLILADLCIALPNLIIFCKRCQSETCDIPVAWYDVKKERGFCIVFSVHLSSMSSYHSQLVRSDKISINFASVYLRTTYCYGKRVRTKRVSFRIHTVMHIKDLHITSTPHFINVVLDHMTFIDF